MKVAAIMMKSRMVMAWSLLSSCLLPELEAGFRAKTEMCDT